MITINKNSLHISTKLRPILLGVAIAGAYTSSLYAQESQSPEIDESEVERITVTSRGRPEILQNVPLAVTAFSAKDIERRGMTELEDVARFTSGFSFEDTEGGAANPSIRGQSTLRGTAREQTVATFVDGVYMPRNWLVDIGTSNLERVEIIKGPQSARFGRNAFAGAINYITKKADTGGFSGSASATIGSDELREFGGDINVAPIEDVLAFRISYDSSEFDGSWGNNHPNANAGVSPGTDGNVGGRDSDTISANIMYKPTDDLTIDLSYFGADRKEEARAGQRLITRYGDGNCGALQLIDPVGSGNTGFSLFCGEYPIDNDEVTVDPRGFGRQLESDIFSASISYDISEAWKVSYKYGKVEADNIAAGTAEADTVNCGGILGPPVFSSLCNFQGSPLGFVDYEQHEMRLAFNDYSAYSLVIGVFMMDGLDSRFSVSANVDPLNTTPLNIIRVTGPGFSNFVFVNEETKTDVQSIFGEFTYEFSDKIRLGVEARYTKEDIATTNLRTDPVSLIGKESFSFFTPSVTFEYDLSEDQLLYASIGRGAKAGGFNPGAVSKPGVERADGTIIQQGDVDDLSVFDAEFNWTYEVGSKNVFVDNKLVMNAAVYITKWADQQINSADPNGTAMTTALTRNLGNATIWGGELEGSLLASDNLTLDFAFSYTKPTYDDGTFDELFASTARNVPPNTVSYNQPCDDIACNRNGDIGGNDLQNAPNTQIALGVQWEDGIILFNQDADYYIRSDVGYQSSYFASAINAAEFPSRNVVNVRAGINFDVLKFSIWARNLLDEKYASNGQAIIQSRSSNILGALYGERLTFGATVSFRF